MKRRIYRKNEQLPPGYWKIESGIVANLTWGDDGCERGIGIFGRGDYLHGNSQIFPYVQKALSEVELIAVKPSAINYQDISCNLEKLVQLLQLRRIPERIKEFLKWIGRYGYPTSDGAVELPVLTHQEIADLLSTTRVSVTRILQELEKSGHIYRNRRRILLKSKGCL